eukprot:3521001-Alexandrium_andersonii.AAC.1
MLDSEASCTELGERSPGRGVVRTSSRASDPKGKHRRRPEVLGHSPDALQRSDSDAVAVREPGCSAGAALEPPL